MNRLAAIASLALLATSAAPFSSSGGPFDGGWCAGDDAGNIVPCWSQNPNNTQSSIVPESPSSPFSIGQCTPWGDGGTYPDGGLDPLNRTGRCVGTQWGPGGITLDGYIEFADVSCIDWNIPLPDGGARCQIESYMNFDPNVLKLEMTSAGIEVFHDSFEAACDGSGFASACGLSYYMLQGDVTVPGLTHVLGGVGYVDGGADSVCIGDSVPGCTISARTDGSALIRGPEQVTGLMGADGGGVVNNVLRVNGGGIPNANNSLYQSTPNTGGGGTHWAVFNSGVAAPTITLNAATAPDGSGSATRVQIPAVTAGTTSVDYVTESALANDGSSTYTTSCYVQGHGSTSGTTYLTWNITTAQAPINFTATWARYSVTWTTASIYASPSVYIGAAASFGQTSSAVDIDVWGCQQEIGNAPGPFVATTSSAAVNQPSTYPTVTPSPSLLVSGAGRFLGSFLPTCNSGAEGSVEFVAGSGATPTHECLCANVGSSSFQWCSIAIGTAAAIVCAGGSATVCP